MNEYDTIWHNLKQCDDKFWDVANVVNVSNFFHLWTTSSCLKAPAACCIRGGTGHVSTSWHGARTSTKINKHIEKPNAFVKWKHLENWATPMGFVKTSGHWVPFYTLVASTCYSTCERYWQVISLPRARAIWCCLAAGTLWSISSAGKGSLTWYLNAI